MKKFDLKVKSGEYEKNGEIKNSYRKVGVMIEGSNGPYILLDKTFNPAGIQDGKENLLISIFEQKGKAQDFGPEPSFDSNSEIPF